jgi:hypothetical protein
VQPPTPVALPPSAVDIAVAFMAGAQFASSMQASGGAQENGYGKELYSPTSDLSSETCSTADTGEELLSPQLTPVAATVAPPEFAQGSDAAEQSAALDRELVRHQPLVLDLSAVLHEPPPPPFGLAGGSPRDRPECCPSFGSVYHHIGLCKPCDFVGRGLECRSGAECRFCHVCGPTERKQRKAQRRKNVRALGRSQLSS